MKKYYLDTCVWRDFSENRISFQGERFGDYADKLFNKIMKEKDKVIYSDIVIKELLIDYTKERIEQMLNMLFMTKTLVKVKEEKEDFNKARDLSKERDLPIADAMHAIIAGRNDCILVTQDKHFQKLKDICEVKKPQEII
jgi:predicted nucleic acid-binding protein